MIFYVAGDVMLRRLKAIIEVRRCNSQQATALTEDGAKWHWNLLLVDLVHAIENWVAEGGVIAQQAFGEVGCFVRGEGSRSN